MFVCLFVLLGLLHFYALCRRPFLLWSVRMKASRHKHRLPAQALTRSLNRRQILQGCIFPDPWYHVGDKEALRTIAYA